MSPSCLVKISRPIASLLIGLFATVATLSIGAPVAESAAGQNSAPVKVDHEVTLRGVVQELVTARAIGSPVGAHVLVSGPQGVVDVHAGPYLLKDTLDTLQSGAAVEVTGRMVWLRGKQYLLARLLTVNGQTLTLRSNGGILLHQYGSRHMKSTKNARIETRGDVR